MIKIIIIIITFIAIGCELVITIYDDIINNQQFTLFTLLHQIGFILMMISAFLIRKGHLQKLAGLKSQMSDAERDAEEKRKVLEAQYRAVVEEQEEFIRRFKADGTITFVNGAFCRYFGKTSEELLGQSFLIFVPKEEREEVKKVIASLNKENPVAVQERRYVRPNGEVRWHQWIIRAVIDHDGVVEYQSVGRDITDKKRFDEQMKESEARYRAVVEDQEELIRRFRPDGTLTFVNGAFCRYFGKTSEELLGRDFLTLLPKEDHEGIRKMIDSLNQEKSVIVSERQFVRPDGEVRWHQWVNRVIISDGKIVEYQSVGRDITVKKKFEQQLGESEARYRAIVEDQTDLIHRCGPDGTLTFVNDAFCRFYGMSAEELVGKEFQTLLHPQEREFIQGQIALLSPDNSVVTTEACFTRPDGRVGWLQYIKRAFFDGERNVLEYQAVARDITAQKDAEMKISEARETVERASKVTTLAVIGGGIAHEINQPLNAIKVLAETVLALYRFPSQPSSEDVLKNVRNICNQVNRIDGIVNNLRSLLRSSQTFAYAPCNMNDVINKALSLFSNQLIAKNIRVRKELKEELPPVNGSFVRFEEVIINLVVNAIQALAGTNRNDKQITIRTWSDEKVHIAISDNGAGIDPESLDKIFEPFFTTRKAADSMGLGLSLVYSIIAASNGSISAENNTWGGATINISLPKGADSCGYKGG